MQENEFEKHVQQKMDELKLQPSDAVWPKIDAQLKKEKRRRLILILLPVLFIISLYGGYLLLSNNNSTGKNEQPANNAVVKNNIANKTKTYLDSGKNNKPITENKNKITNPTSVAETTIVTKTSAEKNNHHQKIGPAGKLKISSTYEIATNSEKNTSLTFRNISDTTRNIIPNEKVNNPQIQNPQQEIITVGQDRPDTILDQTDKSSENVIAEINNNEKEKSEINIDTSAKKITGTIKYPWNWGFSFSAGVSGVTGIGGIVFGDDQKSIMDYSSPQNLSGSSASNPTFTPSAIKSSIAFITGLSAQKNISRKIIFVTGLNYKLLSTTNTVGTDSAAYFRSNSTAGVHHNFFHYIELPVGFRFQIGNAVKTSLYWTIGFSVSQLINSNALQFNRATGLYFHDNTLFNKTQLGFITSFDVALISKQKRSLLIGPYLNYGISKIADQGYNKHHFTFVGLRAQIIFRKK